MSLIFNGLLSQNLANRLPEVDLESLVPGDFEFLMVETQLVQVGDVVPILDGVKAEIVGRAVDDTATPANETSRDRQRAGRWQRCAVSDTRFLTSAVRFPQGVPPCRRVSSDAVQTAPLIPNRVHRRRRIPTPTAAKQTTTTLHSMMLAGSGTMLNESGVNRIPCGPFKPPDPGVMNVPTNAPVDPSNSSTA